jgi:hypothetical protein
MYKVTVGGLDLHRPSPRRESFTDLRLRNIDAVKQKLLEEMVELECQMEKLKGSSKLVDLSLVQTYREMLRSRKAFFNQLNR